MRLPKKPVSRRAVLRTGTGVVAALGLVGLPAPVAGATGNPDPHRDAPGRSPDTRLSANGWEVQDGADIGGAIWTRPVAGSEVSVAVRIGDVETVLQHVIRRYHYEIDTLRAGEVVGFRALSGAVTGHQTNHASGTSVDIRPGWYPAGTRSMSGYTLDVVRDILNDCAGVVAWGGDFSRPEESHFQIDVPPADPALTKVAAKLHGWNNSPGLGAGVMLAGA